MSRPFPVSKETQGRNRITELRREMDAVEVPPPEQTDSEAKTLDQLVELKLKQQLQSLDAKEVGWAIVNSIKFLAVKAKLPVAFGTELDE